MSDIKLYNGDCLEVLKNIPDNSIDLIITSPPYNLNIKYNSYSDNKSYEDYLEWCKIWIEKCCNVLKYGGRIAINIPMEHNLNGKKFICNDYMNILHSCNLIEGAFILWNKRHLTSRTAWGSWKSPSSPNVIQPMECILVYCKGSRKKEGKIENIDISKQEFINNTIGIWKIQPELNRLHPAPFPVMLPINLLKLFSYKNDIILDPFMGSGTTGVACIKTRRNFIEIELDKDYFNMAKNRIDLENVNKRLF